MRLPPPAKKAFLVLGGAAALYAGWIGLSLLFLPPVAPLRDVRRSFVIAVRDWNRKEHPFVVGPRNPHWTPIGAVPASLKKAVIAAEDANFYSHEGVDYEAMREAIKADLEKGRFARGGSTITQQVAKNLFLSREKTVSRKVKEIVLARRMDDVLTKPRILELYLNVAELGPMVYGVGHASRYYFGKSPSALTVRESAILAAMLPGPKVYDPYRKLGRVVRRSDRILRRMYAARLISEGEYRTALAEEANISGLERKVERTMASAPPEEKPLETTRDGEIGIVTSGRGPDVTPADVAAGPPAGEPENAAAGDGTPTSGRGPDVTAAEVAAGPSAGEPENAAAGDGTPSDAPAD